MSRTVRPRDPNPVFQSMIETGREIYERIGPGESRRVHGSLRLLERCEPAGSAGAVERVRAWAEPLRFEVHLEQPPSPQRKPGDMRPVIQPAAMIVITIHKPRPRLVS